MGNNEETELVEKAKSGEMWAFEKLIRRTSGKIYNLGLKLLRNKEDASDLMQETYIKAYQHLNSFRGNSAFATWLYRIATNLALMKMRRDKQQKVSVETLKETSSYSMIKEMPDWTHNPVSYFKKQEMKDILNKAIDSLPSKYKSVFVLHDMEGFPIAEVADMLSLSEPAVKTRSHRSRMYLREKLAEYFNQGVKAQSGQG
ncbi:MAG TPA: sigma-70 family RNA polymerase sigma factor [bacterium]|nr:sigma-70 family RNA polymerase sigma factor [bacterium]